MHRIFRAANSLPLWFADFSLRWLSAAAGAGGDADPGWTEMTTFLLMDTQPDHPMEPSSSSSRQSLSTAFFSMRLT